MDHKYLHYTSTASQSVNLIFLSACSGVSMNARLFALPQQKLDSSVTEPRFESGTRCASPEVTTTMNINLTFCTSLACTYLVAVLC